jgi:hypothetical protein
MRRYLAPAAIVAVFVLFLVGLVLASHALFGGGSSPQTVKVPLGGPHGTPTTTVTVPEKAVERVEQTDVGNHDDLRTEQPDGVPGAILEKAREFEDKLAANDQLPIVTPDAAPSQRGCTTRLVQNFSSRRGVAPREEVVHYTVSPNVVGTSDVNAIAALFDRPSFQASSNYIIDSEGHCLYIVRESDKAWTQAAANPFSISVEVINSGREPVFMGSAGLAKLAMVLSDAADRWKIPVQRGVVTNCIPRTPGILDHNSLGACGGGHHDITPYDVNTVIAAVRAFRAKASPAKRPQLYRITASRPGKVRHVVTPKPGALVGKLAKRGYRRIAVVRVKAA